MPKFADKTKLFTVVRRWTVKNSRSPLDFLYSPQEEGVKDVTQILTVGQGITVLN